MEHHDKLSVGVCVTGLQRTLLHPAVNGSLLRRVVRPLRASGLGVDTFMVVVANWSATPANQSDALRTAITDAFASASLASLIFLEARHVSAGPNGTCGVHGGTAVWAQPWYHSRTIRAPSEGNVRHSNKTLAQFVGLHACYAEVVKRERTLGTSYSWLLRTRTDVVFLQTLRLPHDVTVAYVPQDGMNVHPLALCTNDHLFLCPRHLCRPYFELLELWESPHCRRDARAAATRGSWPLLADGVPETLSSLARIAPTPNASAPWGLQPPLAPTAPFLLPALPLIADAQWYWLARYGGALRGPCDARLTTDENCCGLLREMPFSYDLARDRGSFVLECKMHTRRAPADQLRRWNASNWPFGALNETSHRQEIAEAVADCEAFKRRADRHAYKAGMSLSGALPVSLPLLG